MMNTLDALQEQTQICNGSLQDEPAVDHPDDGLYHDRRQHHRGTVSETRAGGGGGDGGWGGGWVIWEKVCGI